MFTEPTIIWLLVGAFLVEGALGYPQSLFRLIGHPVSWMGRFVTLCDRTFNSQSKNPVADFMFGLLTLLILIGLVGAIAVGVGMLSRQVPFGWGIELIFCATLLAGRSLYDHVSDVAQSLRIGGLAAGRKKISLIVGRNTEALDEEAISRAAIESLAENTSDGVVAPLFWGLVAGLPGIAIYKAVNTADSLIGHRSDRHLWFGKPAARLDDFLNLAPARLTGLLFVVAALVWGKASLASRAMWRDARHHLSPNAGWPEAAMAGALECRLGGPRTYGAGAVTTGAWLGEGRTDLGVSDIERALTLYKIAMVIVMVLLIGVGVVAGVVP